MVSLYHPNIHGSILLSAQVFVANLWGSFQVHPLHDHGPSPKHNGLIVHRAMMAAFIAAMLIPLVFECPFHLLFGMWSFSSKIQKNEQSREN